MEVPALPGLDHGASAMLGTEEGEAHPEATSAGGDLMDAVEQPGAAPAAWWPLCICFLKLELVAGVVKSRTN